MKNRAMVELDKEIAALHIELLRIDFPVLFDFYETGYFDRENRNKYLLYLIQTLDPTARMSLRETSNALVTCLADSSKPVSTYKNKALGAEISLMRHLFAGSSDCFENQVDTINNGYMFLLAEELTNDSGIAADKWETIRSTLNSFSDFRTQIVLDQLLH